MPRITACATLGYAAFNVEIAVAKIAAAGFRRIEITELGAYCRHFPYQQTSAAELQVLLETHDLAPVAMNVSSSRMVDGAYYRPRLSNPQEAPKIVAYADWFLASARELGIREVSFPIGPRVPDADWHAEMAAATATYRQIADLAAAYGLFVNLEMPHLFQFIDSTTHCLAVLDELDHPAVGVTVDASHWGILQYDLDAFFAAIGPRLRHAHLRDSAGADTRDFQQELEMTPGKGTVDFATFGQALDRAGFAGEVTLELEHRHTDLDSIGREFEEGLDHLKRCGWECDIAR